LSITVTNISKSYNGTKALQNISFNVNDGELFGLIGPDGAGKTTLFRVLTTLLIADEGQATVGGFDVLTDYKSIRKSVGYMPGTFSLYQDLTIEENLHFFATVFGTTLSENYDLIKDIYVQIEPFKKRRAGQLSGGMKQKLALCCALIHKPKVLFLDEPTTGVDPVSRKEFWDMLKTLQRNGMTILVSTPYMDEATLCDRTALIQNGRILKIETPKGIVNQFPKIIYSVKANNKHHLIHALKNYEHQYNAYPFGEYVHYIDQRNHFKIEDLKVYLQARNLSQITIEQSLPTIEDAFMEMAR
jgi:ABC-type multidrug transport system ATPase subunit